MTTEPLGTGRLPGMMDGAPHLVPEGFYVVFETKALTDLKDMSIICNYFNLSKELNLQPKIG